MTERIVEDIEVLVALFKAGGWDELRVEFEGTSLLLSNDLPTPSIGGEGSAPAVAVRHPTAGALPPAMVSTEAKPDRSEATDPNWAPVVAPNLGTFYRSPKPGAAPFVEIGQRVEVDTEICLLEVMKLFTSVMAGVAGTVRKIVAVDAQMVEGGQVLFYIEPE